MVLVGLQSLLSGVGCTPEVTEWLSDAQVQVTMPPAAMSTVCGVNVFPLSPTITEAVVGKLRSEEARSAGAMARSAALAISPPCARSDPAPVSSSHAQR